MGPDVIVTQDEQLNHFNWCWNKTIQNFEKESITFKETGQHHDYLRDFFYEAYYLNDNFEGGELVFYTFNNKTMPYKDIYSGQTHEAWIMEDCFTYKPEAGDALFLQTDVWHAVLPMRGGSKFYARQLLFDNERIIKNKYMEEYKENFDAFYELEFAKAKQNRITPILYKSLDEIDFDFQIQYLGQDDTKIPCYISSYKN